MSDIGVLEATSQGQLQRNLREASLKVNALLEAKMSQYRRDISASMFIQRKELHELLTAIVQPLLNMITDDGSKALNVEFKEEHLDLPNIDLNEFESEMNHKMQAMVERKREMVTKTRQEHKVKHGACCVKYTETEDVRYQELETTGYKISAQSLKSCWQEHINKLINVSQKSTEILIEEEIIGEVEKIQIEIKSRCDNFIGKIQVQVEQKTVQKSSHSDSYQDLKHNLEKLDDTLQSVIRLRAMVAIIDDSDCPGFGFHWIEEIGDVSSHGRAPV
jgi:hypothetical protein